MKSFFATALFLSALAMNMDMVCKSLCMAGGHGNVNHTSHTMMEHAMHRQAVCPITHTAHHSMPQTSIKCNCAADNEASIGYELTLTESASGLTPYFHIVSQIHSHRAIVLSKELAPSEGPPKILS